MLQLKDAIAEKHSLAEKMTFNQRMFNGELSNEEYISQFWYGATNSCNEFTLLLLR